MVNSTRVAVISAGPWELKVTLSWREGSLPDDEEATVVSMVAEVFDLSARSFGETPEEGSFASAGVHPLSPGEYSRKTVVEAAKGHNSQCCVHSFKACKTLRSTRDCNRGVSADIALARMGKIETRKEARRDKGETTETPSGKMCLLDFPTEVLVNIFSKVPPVHLVNVCGLVCRRFAAITGAAGASNTARMGRVGCNFGQEGKRNTVNNNNDTKDDGEGEERGEKPSALEGGASTALWRNIISQYLSHDVDAFAKSPERAKKAGPQMVARSAARSTTTARRRSFERDTSPGETQKRHGGYDYSDLKYRSLVVRELQLLNKLRVAHIHSVVAHCVERGLTPLVQVLLLHSRRGNSLLHQGRQGAAGHYPRDRHQHEDERERAISAESLAPVFGESLVRLPYHVDVNCSAPFAFPRAKSLLHCAVKTSNVEMVELLVRYNASITLHRGDLLVTAVDQNSVGIVHVLLRHRADVNCATERFNNTPAIAAVKRRNHRMLSLLHQLARDTGQTLQVNAQHHSGKTALFFAVENEDIEAVQTLLRYRAEINIQDRRGMTPLDIAQHCCSAHKEKINALLVSCTGASTSGVHSSGLSHDQ